MIKIHESIIEKNFPWFCYTLALLIESGQSWSSAIFHLLPTLPTSLQKELHKMMNDLLNSKNRNKTLENYKNQQTSQTFKRFIFILTQTIEKGTSMAAPLKNLSSDLYFEKETKIEKKKHLLGTKMLLPLFLFIFPAVLIIMMTPLLIYLKKTGFF